MEALGLDYTFHQARYLKDPEFTLLASKQVARLLVRSEQISLFLGLKRRLAAKNRQLAAETQQKLNRLREEEEGNETGMFAFWPDGEGQDEWATITNRFKDLYRVLERIRFQQKSTHPGASRLTSRSLYSSLQDWAASGERTVGARAVSLHSGRVLGAHWS